MLSRPSQDEDIEIGIFGHAFACRQKGFRELSRDRIQRIRTIELDVADLILSAQPYHLICCIHACFSPNVPYNGRSELASYGLADCMAVSRARRHSATILSINSEHVGMSSMRPTAWLAHTRPPSTSPFSKA